LFRRGMNSTADPRDPPTSVRVVAEPALREPPTGLWVVAGSALIAAVIGSFAAAVLDFTLVPSGSVGGVPGLPNSGIPTSLLDFMFGIPIAGLAAAVVAYAGVVFRRPFAMGLAAVLVGSAAGTLVGVEVSAVGNWWLSLPSDTSRTASILTVVIVLLSATAIALSVRLPVVGLAKTRRGRVAGVLALAAFSGLMIGVFVGGLAAGVTALQSPCASFGSACGGPSALNAIQGGALLGAWFGGGVGLAGGALAWAFPPWSAAASSVERPTK
jgi:hypothetical protein